MWRIKAIIICITLFAVTSCSKDIPYVPEIVSRTVLIYMMADNSLSNHSAPNIASMMQGAANGNLNGGNLIVYVDTRNETPKLIQLKEGRDGKIQQFTVKDYPEHSSVSSTVIKEVFSDVMQRFPAESYGLDLWSHGSAWLPSDFHGMMRSIGQDGNDWLEITTLKTILTDVFGKNKLEFILFDACNMASIEVAYELRNNTKEIIASQAEVMGIGFPYQSIIKDMFSKKVSSENICRSFYDFYQNYAYPYGCISYTKTNDLEQLAAISKIIIQQDIEKATHLNLNQVQFTDYLASQGRLLYDMRDYIQHLATTDQLKVFSTNLSNAIPYSASTPELYFGNLGGAITIDPTRLCGTSIYVMQPKYGLLNDWYKQLDWYKAVYE